MRVNTKFVGIVAILAICCLYMAGCSNVQESNEAQEGTESITDYEDFPDVLDFGAYSGLELLSKIPQNSDGIDYLFTYRKTTSIETTTKYVEGYLKELEKSGFYESRSPIVLGDGTTHYLTNDILEVSITSPMDPMAETLDLRVKEIAGINNDDSIVPPRELRDYEDIPGLLDFGAYSGLELAYKYIGTPRDNFDFKLDYKGISQDPNLIEDYISELEKREYYEYQPPVVLGISQAPTYYYLTNDTYAIAIREPDDPKTTLEHFTITVNDADTINIPEASEPIYIPDNPLQDKKILDSDGKQIWKVYVVDNQIHFNATYQGEGHFSIKVLGSNQDLVELVCNEIGDYIVDKTVYNLIPGGMYYIEINCTRGSWEVQWSGTEGR